MEEGCQLFQVGYNIKKSHWNHRYTTEAMKAILDFAVRNLGIRKVSGGHAKENPASAKVIEKLGFIYDRDDVTPHVDGIRHFESKEYYLNLETNEERRARIYPIILSEYNPEWPEWYAEEADRLSHLFGSESIVRIMHIGSTSVPGLAAKPTIDILLEIGESVDIENLIAVLPENEYICLRQQTIPTPDSVIFLKGYTDTGFAEKVFHIHVRNPGDWDELYFRDYLIAHPEAVSEYAALKRKLLKDYEHDRDGYTEAKGKFIKEYTKRAKKDAKIKTRIRAMQETDYECLPEFLYQAIFIPKGVDPPPRSVIHDPEIFVYIENFGTQRGDLGAVAEQNGKVIGAAWTRIIPGFGHLDKETPELAISVLPEFRGNGIGTKLMKKLFEELRENGYNKTSLSVQKDNPAVRFYQQLGYEICGDRVDHAGHEDYLMTKEVRKL